MQEVIINLLEHKENSIRVYIRPFGQQRGRTDIQHQDPTQQIIGRGIKVTGAFVDRNGRDEGRA